MVSTSVALLSDGSRSTEPVEVTEAVLLSVPDAAGSRMPLAVKVTVAPTGRLTVALMLPEPEDGQVPPPAAVQDQRTPVTEAGKLSVTVAPLAPVTASGPALNTVIVQVSDCPGETVVKPSSLVICRLATGLKLYRKRSCLPF